MFEEIGGRKKYYSYKECTKGQVLAEGVFRKEGVDPTYKKPYWEFMTQEHGLVHLNYSGNLEYKMQFIEEGDWVKIVYDGTYTLEKGPFAGKEAHQFLMYRRKSDDTAKEESNDDAAAPFDTSDGTTSETGVRGDSSDEFNEFGL